MNPSMGPPLLTKKEEKLTKRIKELESFLKEYTQDIDPKDDPTVIYLTAVSYRSLFMEVLPKENDE